MLQTNDNCIRLFPGNKNRGIISNSTCFDILMLGHFFMCFNYRIDYLLRVRKLISIKCSGVNNTIILIQDSTHGIEFAMFL